MSPPTEPKPTDLPRRAGDAPFAFDLVQGKTYAWCACGLSETQPFCDGSHKGTGMMPVVFNAKKSETVYFCMCKRTKTAPYCDDSHAE